MQTAVEQLMIALYEGGYLKGNGNEMDDILKKYKEVEKQQMISFYVKGCEDTYGMDEGTDDVKDGEQYYTKTYGNKGSDDKFDVLKEMFELEQQLDIPSHMRWHNKTSSQTEISDEEIENEAHIQYPVNLQPNGRTLAGGRYDIDINYSERNAYILSAKWMRDKIQNK